MAASSAKRMEICELLINNGADVNMRDKVRNSDIYLTNAIIHNNDYIIY